MSIDDSKDYGLLDRLAGEFADRLRRGERPTIREYAERYPQLADLIREAFPALITVEEVEEIGPDREQRRGRRCRRSATTGSSARSATGAWGWSTRPSRPRSAAAWP